MLNSIDAYDTRLFGPEKNYEDILNTIEIEKTLERLGKDNNYKPNLQYQLDKGKKKK